MIQKNSKVIILIAAVVLFLVGMVIMTKNMSNKYSANGLKASDDSANRNVDPGSGSINPVSISAAVPAAKTYQLPGIKVEQVSGSDLVTPPVNTTAIQKVIRPVKVYRPVSTSTGIVKPVSSSTSVSDGKAASIPDSK